MTALHYVYISMLFTSTMLCSIFLISWLTIDRKLHTLLWAMLYAVSVVNMLLNALKDLFPDPSSYWIVVNATSLLIHGLAIGGYRHRSGLTPFPKWVVGYLLLVELGIIFFTVVEPHMGMRVALTPLFGAVMATLCIRALRHKTALLRAAEKGVIIAYGLYFLTQLAIASAALMQGPERDDYWLDIYSQLNFLVMPASYSGLGLFTVLLIADDLAVRMRHLATTDQLTGLPNRRGFLEAAENLLAECRRQSASVFLTLVDLDHFKKINDRYGHYAGDQALRQFAKVLRQQLRQADVAGRMGGEEFAILFRAEDQHTANYILERVRQTLASTPVEVAEQRFIMTASFGVHLVDDNDASSRSLSDSINMADQALYRAKAEGRNRIESTAHEQREQELVTA